MNLMVMSDLHLSKKSGLVCRALRMGAIEIIGLNCVSHWRRLVFHNGAQLKWLEAHLEASDARRHILLCHAPLQAHYPMRSRRQPYLSRDAHLQRIVDAHGNIIFISGHAHISMESPVGCVERDELRGNIYINDGSIRPTTLLNEDGRPEAEPARGNVVGLCIDAHSIAINARSIYTGKEFFRVQYPA